MWSRSNWHWSRHVARCSSSPTWTREGSASRLPAVLASPSSRDKDRYFGPPTDDAHAISELKRLHAAGATHFVLLWPAFWFFDTYPLFEQHLRNAHRCLLENARAVVFELT